MAGEGPGCQGRGRPVMGGEGQAVMAGEGPLWQGAAGGLEESLWQGRGCPSRWAAAQVRACLCTYSHVFTRTNTHIQLPSTQEHAHTHMLHNRPQTRAPTHYTRARVRFPLRAHRMCSPVLRQPPPSWALRLRPSRARVSSYRLPWPPIWTPTSARRARIPTPLCPGNGERPPRGAAPPSGRGLLHPACMALQQATQPGRPPLLPVHLASAHLA